MIAGLLVALGMVVVLLLITVLPFWLMDRRDRRDGFR